MVCCLHHNDEVSSYFLETWLPMSAHCIFYTIFKCFLLTYFILISVLFKSFNQERIFVHISRQWHWETNWYMENWKVSNTKPWHTFVAITSTHEYWSHHKLNNSCWIKPLAQTAFIIFCQQWCCVICLPISAAIQGIWTQPPRQTLASIQPRAFLCGCE